MPQAVMYQEGAALDYTPGADVAAGAVVLIGNIVCVTKRAIAANTQGELHTEGVFKFVKKTGAILMGAPVYWDVDGDPVVGTAGSGAASATAADGTLAGYAAAAAASGDETVKVKLAQLPELGGGGAGVSASVGASTAAAGSTSADAGVLPAGTAEVYPTTAADDLKGVRIHAADAVIGRRIVIGNGVANKILKIYPNTGGTINGAAVDAAYSTASGKGAVLVCVAANTWIATG